MDYIEIKTKRGFVRGDIWKFDASSFGGAGGGGGNLTLLSMHIVPNTVVLTGSSTWDDLGVELTLENGKRYLVESYVVAGAQGDVAPQADNINVGLFKSTDLTTPLEYSVGANYVGDIPATNLNVHSETLPVYLDWTAEATATIKPQAAAVYGTPHTAVVGGADGSYGFSRFVLYEVTGDAPTVYLGTTAQ